eukprot:387601-Rhodomonas_salina.1
MSVRVREKRERERRGSVGAGALPLCPRSPSLPLCQPAHSPRTTHNTHHTQHPQHPNRREEKTGSEEGSGRRGHRIFGAEVLKKEFAGGLGSRDSTLDSLDKLSN